MGEHILSQVDENKHTLKNGFQRSDEAKQRRRNVEAVQQADEHGTDTKARHPGLGCSDASTDKNTKETNRSLRKLLLLLRGLHPLAPAP